jgi:pimeloyl-ACP methyl ester carboxylesterase
LAKDHQVVLMRTGYSCCGERINLARLSQELDLILKKFSERSEVILLAHSGGASIALDYLKLNIKVKTILVSWIYDMSWIKLYYEKNKEAPSRIALLEEMNALTSDPKEGLKNRMLAFAKDYFQNPERSAAKEIFEINGYYPEIASPIEEELKSGLSFSESLANAPQPILSIVGKNDRVIFPEYYDYLPEGIRNKIEMVTLDDSGHFPFIDQPQQLKNLVNKFILSFEQ